MLCGKGECAMSRTAKIWLIIAAALVLVGCLAFAVAMTMLNWNFINLSTNKYETNSYEISEDFGAISVKTDTANVDFVATDSSKCSVECYDREKLRHTVSVKDGTLVIEIVDTRKWYEYIGINFGSPKITVYLPKGEYGALSVRGSTGNVELTKGLSFKSIDISESTGNVKSYATASGAVKIKTSTGKISVENISAGSLELSASTGNITLTNVTCGGDVRVSVTTGKSVLINVKCESLETKGSTGGISMDSVIAKENLSAERSTGRVSFRGCDASEIYVKTSTGNVEGSLLSEKVFITKTDTGRIEVPSSTTGGVCKITTDTGDIKITVG